MPKFDIYAMGNALVDMEYEVKETDLGTLGIDKGVMTLVDEVQQIDIMRHLNSHKPNKASGGSAANSIIALAQLGGKGFYSCKVADDELGNFYMNDLIAGGVDTNHHHKRETGHTGRCLVLVTPDSDRTMLTHLGISGALSQREMVEDALRESTYFYTEGYLVTSEPARKASIEAKRIADEAGVKSAISLSDPNMVTYFRDGLLEMIDGGMDLIFANESEALGLADADDLNDAVAYLKTIAKEFVITRGPNGALIFGNDELIEIDAVPVKPVDTNGAGDMFAGAFLYGLTQGWSHAEAGRLAANASSRLITQLGPRLKAEETREVLASIAN